MSDFGLSRALDYEESHAAAHSADGSNGSLGGSGGSALGGTIAYTAPETFAHNCLKKPADVYAYGIMRERAVQCMPVPCALLPCYLAAATADDSWGVEGGVGSNAVYRCMLDIVVPAAPGAAPESAPVRPVLPPSPPPPPLLHTVWEMFYCSDPYEGLLDGQICVGVTGGRAGGCRCWGGVAVERAEGARTRATLADD